MNAPTPTNTSSTPNPRSVLFVCLGNICRSPLARCLFEHLVTADGLRDRLDIDSCGTGHWHVGGPADHRACAVAARHGLRLIHKARLLDPAADFDRFDLILPMDRSNLTTLLERGCPRHKARLFLSSADQTSLADPDFSHLKSLEVPDPYLGGEDGFEQVYRLVFAASRGLLHAVRTPG